MNYRSKIVRSLGLAAALSAFFGSPAGAQTIQVTPVKANATYAPGETVAWDVHVTDTADAATVHYVIKRDASTIVSQGDLPLTAGAAHLETKLDTPGTLLTQFTLLTGAGAKTKSIVVGAVVDPYRILPSSSRPADFDAFWKAQVSELETVPIDPKLTPEPSGVDGVDYALVSLDNVKGSHVQGQIARPTAGQKFPALLLVQYAGVYGLPKTNVTGYARGGWLTLNINAHDLPIDQPAEFYTAQANGPLNNYPAIGAESRETSYFRRMALGCVRAVDYLKTRPDWDGKTIVVSGTSQGGMQALMIGGLDSAITAVIANVPAGCDTSAPTIGRAAPWPFWTNFGRGNPAVLNTSRYYDALNFARSIHAPTLMAVGLLDTTAPAPGDIAAFNTIPGPQKRLLIMEHSDHTGTGGTQAEFQRTQRAWLKALYRGDPPPLAPDAEPAAP